MASAKPKCAARRRRSSGELEVTGVADDANVLFRREAVVRAHRVQELTLSRSPTRPRTFYFFMLSHRTTVVHTGALTAPGIVTKACCSSSPCTPCTSCDSNALEALKQASCPTLRQPFAETASALSPHVSVTRAWLGARLQMRPSIRPAGPDRPPRRSHPPSARRWSPPPDHP